MGHPRWSPIPGPPEGGLPQLQRSWFEKGYLFWGQAVLSGRPRVHSALAPLGPLCSEGGKATEGFCQLWAGAGSRGLLSWLRSVAWRGLVGLLRSGRIPGFSSTGRYCTEQEEVPIGRKETRPAFSLCLFSHSRDYSFFLGLVPPEEGLVLGGPKWLLQLLMVP